MTDTQSHALFLLLFDLKLRLCVPPANIYNTAMFGTSHLVIYTFLVCEQQDSHLLSPEVKVRPFFRSCLYLWQQKLGRLTYMGRYHRIKKMHILLRDDEGILSGSTTKITITTTTAEMVRSYRYRINSSAQNRSDTGYDLTLASGMHFSALSCTNDQILQK